MFVLFCCEKVTCGVHLYLIIFFLLTLTWVRFIIFSVDSLIVTCYFFSTSDFFLFFRNFLLALIIKLPVWCIILIFYSNFNVSIYHWIKIWMTKAMKIFQKITSHSKKYFIDRWCLESTFIAAVTWFLARAPSRSEKRRPGGPVDAISPYYYVTILPSARVKIQITGRAGQSRRGRIVGTLVRWRIPDGGRGQWRDDGNLAHDP